MKNYDQTSFLLLSELCNEILMYNISHDKQSAFNLLVELSNEILIGNLTYTENIAEVCKLAKQAGASQAYIEHLRKKLNNGQQQIKEHLQDA